MCVYANLFYIRPTLPAHNTDFSWPADDRSVYDNFTVLYRTETHQIPWIFYLPKQLNPIRGLENCFFKISFNIMKAFSLCFKVNNLILCKYLRLCFKVNSLIGFFWLQLVFYWIFVSHMILLVYFNPHVGFLSLSSVHVFSINVPTLRSKTKFHTHSK